MKKNHEMLVAIIFMGIARVSSIFVFGMLALHFNQWWIALFSLLYAFEYKRDSSKEGKEQADGQ